MSNRYGNCEICGAELLPDWFTEKEVDSYGNYTFRVRRAVNVLYCPHCLKDYCVDDSFDQPWYRATPEEWDKINNNLNVYSV